MFKVIRPVKDAYITNRIIDGDAQLKSNVGSAASLDLFKLYDYSATMSGSVRVPNTEVSRLLVKFDLSPLRQLQALGQLDTTNRSFSCRLCLHDVFGGQPTPDNFTIVAYPLSASFDEGRGRDIVLYSDSDVCNFLSGSRTGGSWFMSGCGLGGGAQQQCDYITGSSAIQAGASLRTSQAFVTGEEDLNLDVTTIVSATLAGLLPDNGFRISFDPSLETDNRTYFVKRFAARTAFNEDLRPKLLVRFDDSIQDDTNNVVFGSPNTLFLYNYVRSGLANLVSGSTAVTGSNSVSLRLTTPVSGGSVTLSFVGSQHYSGINPVVGVYSASVTLPTTNPAINEQLQASGSVTFTPVWRSLDGSVAFLTGSAFKAYPPTRSATSTNTKAFEVSIVGFKEEYAPAEVTTLRIHVFDYTSAVFLAPVKGPVEDVGVIIRDVHFQVRDANTGRVAVPFDLVSNSTRVSNDASGMYFRLDIADLTAGHSYVIDIMTVTGNNQQLFKAVSGVFRVDASA